MPSGNAQLFLPKWVVGCRLKVNGRWQQVVWMSADGSAVKLEPCAAPPPPLPPQSYDPGGHDGSDAARTLAAGERATARGRELDVEGEFCWTRDKGNTVLVKNRSWPSRTDVVNCYDDGTPIREQGRGAARIIPGWIWSEEHYRYLKDETFVG